jgi:hypothetical protein
MGETPNFWPPYAGSKQSQEQTSTVPQNITVKTYCTALTEYMQHTRGKDLPGTVGSHAVRAVFRQQSLPWESFAQEYTDACHNFTLAFLRSVVEHVAGTHTGHALLKEFCFPKMDARHLAVDEKLQELLWPVCSLPSSLKETK